MYGKAHKKDLYHFQVAISAVCTALASRLASSKEASKAAPRIKCHSMMDDDSGRARPNVLHIISDEKTSETRVSIASTCPVH